MDDQLKQLIEMNNLLMKQLHEKHDTSSTSFTAVPLHGNTTNGAGIWSTSGLSQDVISAHLPSTGLIDVLPVIPSQDTSPLFPSLTGFSDDLGSEATNVCDPGPTAYMKSCILTAMFGRLRRSSEVVDITQSTRRFNRGEFMDLRLANPNVFGGSTVAPSVSGNFLNSMAASMQTNVGVQLIRELCRQLWNGVVTNSTAGGGFQEFPGLDVQIATGQVDAITNIACPSLDSDVKDFNYNLVDSNVLNIVYYIQELEKYLTSKGSRTQLSPSYVFVMTRDLWYELTAVWPCLYNTNRCGFGGLTDARVIVNGSENVAQTELMRRTQQLDINGRSYRVVLDDCINEKNSTTNAELAAGQYASSIYMIPIATNTGMPLTFRQHIDYRTLGSEMAALRNSLAVWPDLNGQYIWALDQTTTCWQLHATTEQRVVLRAPQLAGRIDNVAYQPMQHIPAANPDSPYWQDGGVSTRTGSTRYAVWDTR